MPVLGVAHGWGRVVEHARGWRVAEARITALVCPTGPVRALRVPGRPMPVAGAADHARLVRVVRDVADSLGVGVIDPAGHRDLRDAWVMVARRWRATRRRARPGGSPVASPPAGG